jgi:hypothetical protein
MWVPKDRNAEAALAVDEADDPLLETWPFLLIVRTGRIFTSHVPTIRRGCDIGGTVGSSEFPANSQLHSRRHRREGQFGVARHPDSYLRTLIVRAAVYRRLDSELRRRSG